MTELGLQAIYQGHGLDGGSVVQAQDHQIGQGHAGALGLRVFALCRVDAEQFHPRHVLQAFADLQTRGACLAVNKNLCHVWIQYPVNQPVS